MKHDDYMHHKHSLCQQEECHNTDCAGKQQKRANLFKSRGAKASHAHAKAKAALEWRRPQQLSAGAAVRVLE
jgi:hypothetical protein